MIATTTTTRKKKKEKVPAGANGASVAHRPPAPEPPEGPQAPAGVWYVSDFPAYPSYAHLGYLVAPAGLDFPVALCLTDGTRQGENDAFDAANHIAGNPAGDWGPLGRAVDLRDCGHLDARRPVPGWVYGLQCRPADWDGGPVDVPAVSPNPFCRFRLARLLHQHNAMYFTAEELAEMPLATLGITQDRADGIYANILRTVSEAGEFVTVPPARDDDGEKEVKP
jgi:hypothetical protein